MPLRAISTRLLAAKPPAGIALQLHRHVYTDARLPGESAVEDRLIAHDHGSLLGPLPRARPQAAPLAALPLSTVVRSFVIMSMSSNGMLLDTSTRLLHLMLRSRNVFFDMNRNRPLRWLLKSTFYRQFCAGENRSEVLQSAAGLRAMGYHGVILEYAKEVLDKPEALATAAAAEFNERSIRAWLDGVLETIDMSSPGEFIALKWSGMGSDTLSRLQNDQDPSPSMMAAMERICEAAMAKNIALLPAAEPQNANRAVDDWTLRLAQRFNTRGRAVVYGTYQCYLKSTPSTLSQHLAKAAEGNFTLGVKLVRGAYMESEPRHLIWDTKSETDSTYDGLTFQLLRRSYAGILESSQPERAAFPQLEVMLATHNDQSVLRAQAIQQAQRSAEQEPVRLSYAQLQGMADEVSCDLVQSSGSSHDLPRVYKYVPWGTLGECMTYLLRRAAENKDAMQRTRHTRRAMSSEIFRRSRTLFGLA